MIKQLLVAWLAIDAAFVAIVGVLALLEARRRSPWRARRFDVRVKFEPRDVWVGVYWTLDGTIWRVHVCLVPMVPVRLSWWTRAARSCL